MDLELIAVAGVLLLGAGVTVLLVNLRKERGAIGTLDQIGTYGYVAEATGGSEVEGPGRRALDSLAGPLGDPAARPRRAPARSVRRGRGPSEADLGGDVRNDAAQAARVPGHPEHLPCTARALGDSGPGRLRPGRDPRGCRRGCTWLVPSERVRRPPQAFALRDDRPAVA